MSSATRHTFVFADLAGFTALTEAHGDDRAADLALEFCAAINRLLPSDAEDLKMLGDACLLRIGSAEDAVALGLAVTSELSTRHGFPDVRIGMHTGTAVRRGSEWFGATINIAARVAALAGRDEVLLTAATREAMGADFDVRLSDRGVHELRHVSTPVQVYRAHAPRRPAGDHRWELDPVCHMRLDPNQVATSTIVSGAVVHFCSTACSTTFSSYPDRYRVVK